MDLEERKEMFNLNVKEEITVGRNVAKNLSFLRQNLGIGCRYIKK